MATIWGRATSSNVQIAMWASIEVGIEVERLDVGGAFGGTDTEEYRAMNPNGLIPVFTEGELVLFESAAILRYLGARYGSEAFWPTDAKSRALLDIWAEWTKSTVCPVLIYEVFWTLVRTPKAERDIENLAVQVNKLGEFMAIADERIGTGPFLGGDHFTFADVMFGHTLYRYFTLDFTRRDLPNLAAYYGRLQERPAYTEHVMVDYSSLKVE
ncbi:MAG: glutathione S-transferase family protein [Rhizobiaceae bacterium]